jgi:hypothetical protein
MLTAESVINNNAALSNANSGTGRQFIFVGGAPRSGTTLLQNMLDSHPDIVGGPEFLHLPNIVDVRNKLQNSISKDRITEFSSSEKVDHLTRNFIESFLLNLLDRYGAQYLSEKTPENVLIFSELMELFPESRFIQIVRDPRATVSSLLQVGKRTNKKAGFARCQKIWLAIKYVQQCLDAGFDAVRKDPDRILTVSYERLVQDPVVETQRICDFLNISWSEQMTRPGEFKHIGEQTMTEDQIWYDAKTYNRNPQKSEVKKWSKNLTLLQQARVNLAFRDHPELSRLGYCLSSSTSLTPVVRLLELALQSKKLLKARRKYSFSEI